MKKEEKKNEEKKKEEKLKSPSVRHPSLYVQEQLEKGVGENLLCKNRDHDKPYPTSATEQ